MSSQGSEVQQMPIPQTQSQAAFLAAKLQNPTATAGEGAMPLYSEMSEWMLLEQLKGLVGSVVVYCCVHRDAKDGGLQPYAAKLVATEGGFEVTRSTAYNYIDGCVPHVGPDELYPIPHPDFLYSSVLYATVFQT